MKSKFLSKVVSVVISGAMLITAMLPLSAVYAAGDEPVNLALGKTVTANVEGDLIPMDPQLITDGNNFASDADTFVLRSTKDKYITIDLENSYDISQIKYFGSMTGNEPNYTNISNKMVMRVSNDPNFADESTFTVFNTDSTNKWGFGEGTDKETINNHDGITINFETKNARYIRYYQDGATQTSAPSTITWLSAAEIEVYENAAVQPPVDPETVETIARDASAAGSSYRGGNSTVYAASNAIDGKLDTAWISSCQQGVEWDSAPTLTLSWDSLISVESLKFWANCNSNFLKDTLYVNYTLKGITGNVLATGRIDDVYGDSKPIKLNLPEKVSGIKSMSLTILPVVGAGNSNDAFGFKEVEVTGSYDPKTPITSFEAATVTTDVGYAPILPATVRANHQDGTSSTLDVIWDEIDPASYATEGNFIVSGSIADGIEIVDGAKPQVKVYVNKKETVDIKAGDMTIKLNGAGVIVGLIAKDGKNYAEGTDVPQASLIKLVMAPTAAEGGERSGKSGTEVKPVSVTKNEGVYTFIFGNGVEIDITAIEKDNYATLEVTRVNKNGLDIELIMWGPVTTNIKKNFGETIGIVYDDEFAIGVKGLNDKSQMVAPADYMGATVGGVKTPSLIYPTDYTGFTGRIWPVNYSATAITTWGSYLMGYTYDATVERTRYNPFYSNSVLQRVPALKGPDAQLEGSKIAIYGRDFGDKTAKDSVLDTVGKIEVNEGLPHPVMDDGEWQKTSVKSTQPYFILDVNANTIDKISQYANMAGINNVYQNSLYLGGGSGSSYQFPGGDAAMKAIVDKAATYNVKVGTHTLSGFINYNDGYAAPDMVNKNAFAGSVLSSLTADANKGATEIFVGDDWYDSGRTKQLGDDLFEINTPVKIDGGYKIPLKSALKFDHKVGENILGLCNNQYGGLAAGPEQAIGIGTRLAESFNNTGINQISFDGVEAGEYMGLGTYGVNLVMNTFYDKLNDKNILSDSSGGYPNGWSGNTRQNWGEPWGAAMRGGMIDYRYNNQVYFDRNFTPKMLGWFMYNGGQPTIDIEWMLSKSAGFDAGYALVTSSGTLNGNGNTPEVLEAVKEWQLAREAKAFTKDQQTRMLDTSTDWHLVKTGDGTWDLTRINYPIDPTTVSYNENGSKFTKSSIFHNQALNMELQAVNGAITNPTITIGGKTVTFETTIPQNHYLIYKNGEASITDGSWNKKEIAINVIDGGVIVKNGKNNVTVNFDATSAVKANIRIMDESAPEPVFHGNTATGPVEEPGVAVDPENTNVALNKPVTIAYGGENGELMFGTTPDKVTDGVIKPDTGLVARSTKGAYVTIDLGEEHNLQTVKMFGDYTSGYPDYKNTSHGVVVQLANKEDFSDAVTIFNNDAKNVWGFGAGTDTEEANTPEGREIILDAPVNAKYIRYYQESCSQNPNGLLAGRLSIFEIEAYEPVDTTIHAPELKTYLGNAPVLPTKVAAENADGLIEYLPVTWDAVPAESYGNVGLFKVNGVVTGSDRKVIVDVIVTDQPIALISGNDQINIKQGKEFTVSFGLKGLTDVTKQTLSFYYDKELLFFPQDGTGVKVKANGTTVSDFAINNESAIFSFVLNSNPALTDPNAVVELTFKVRDDLVVGNGKMARVELKTADIVSGAGDTALTPTVFNMFINDIAIPVEANKRDLIALIDYAKAQMEEDEYKFVVPVVKKALTDRLEIAEIVRDKADATQEAVDNAYKSLLKIVQMLSYVGDNTTLKELYNVWKDYDSKLYTDETVAVMDAALLKAKGVIDNENALQAEIDEAMKALEAAVTQMDLKPIVDKSDLADKIAEAADYNAKLDEYVDDAGKTEFIAAYDEALVIFANADATQDEVEASITRLSYGIFGLREKPSKENLDKLINATNKLEALLKDNEYTPESTKAARTTLKKVEAANKNELLNNDDVVALIDEVTDVTNSLVKADNGNTPETPKDETQTPVKPVEDTEDKNETTDETKDETVPTTSDGTPIGVAFALALIGCAVVVIRKKTTK